MSQAAESKRSSSWLWVALLLTLGLTVWTAWQEETDLEVPSSISEPAVRGKVFSAKTDEAIGNVKEFIDWSSLERSPDGKPKDLFATANWQPRSKATRQKIKEETPPPPQAPPLPFTYMGRMDDGPLGDVIYLADQEQSYTVKPGDLINQFWRLDKEDTERLYFTYMPLNLTSTLFKN